MFGSSSPFGESSSGMGASTPTPACVAAAPAYGGSSVFGQSTPAFGVSSTPAFGSTVVASPFAFGGGLAPAFGQANSSPACGSSPSPFGQSSGGAFGSSKFEASAPSLFGQSSPAFGVTSAPAFGGGASAPAFIGQTSSAFGGGVLFGNSQAASSGGGLFGASTPVSQPFGSSPAPSFGSTSFGNTSTPGSLFGQTKPAGLTQSSSSSLFSGFGPTPTGQTPNTVNVMNLHTLQQGTNNIFGAASSSFNQQNAFGLQQPLQNVILVPSPPATNPCGTLPAMAQITTGRSTSSGPSVLHGMSSTPVAFFSGGDDTPSTPKANMISIPSLFYDQCPKSSSFRLYSYKPLDIARKEIRLIKLQTPIKSQPLCGNIIHAPLSAELRYWALSYCWGSLAGKRTIILDGKKLQITVNLDDALRQLGNSYGMLWVDAICINQEDIPERSREVLRMGEIYSLASGVVAWLGVANKTSNSAMDFLQVLATKAPRFQYDEYLKELPSEFGPGKFADEWIALMDLVRNGYWSRTWIIQELLLCRRSKIVHCGRKFLPWDMFKLVFGETDGHIYSKCIANLVLDVSKKKEVFGYLQNDVSKAKEVSGCLQNLVYLSTFERLLEHKSTLVCGLLRLTSSFLATDPRDKIYGMLAMNEELQKFVPCPNYANPKGVVFRDLARAMLAGGYNLDLICLKSPTHINQLDVESWVPNWDVHDLLGRSPNWLLKVIDDKGSKSPYFVDALKDDASPILRVRGISYDKVDGLGSSEVQDLLFSNEETKMKRYDAVKPDHNQNAYGSDVDTLKALKELRQENFHQGYSLNNEGFVLTAYRKTDLEFLQGLQRTMEFSFGGRCLEQWYEMICTHEHALPLASSLSRISDVELGRMKDSLGREMFDVWRWLSTDRGYLGRTHLQTHKGDEIVIVQGCSVPMVLRPCGEHYSVICAAYVQGIMNGEALQELSDDQMRYFDLA